MCLYRAPEYSPGFASMKPGMPKYVKEPKYNPPAYVNMKPGVPLYANEPSKRVNYNYMLPKVIPPSSRNNANLPDAAEPYKGGIIPKNNYGNMYDIRPPQVIPASVFGKQ